MSLFLVQTRKFHVPPGRALPTTYPSEIVVDIAFGPEDAFGVHTESRTTVGEGLVKLTYLAEEGGIQIQDVIIERIETVTTIDRFTAQFLGNDLKFSFIATSLDDAFQVLTSLNQLLVIIYLTHPRSYAIIDSL